MADSETIGRIKTLRADFLKDSPQRFFVNENSPLSGEFQKGEAYTYPQKALFA